VGPEGVYFGRAVTAIEDLTGDGKEEIVVGATGDLNPESGLYTGSVSIYSGADGTFLFKLYGYDPEEEFGYAVAKGGDIDGDGKEDLIVGAPGGRPYGKVYIIAMDSDGDGLSNGQEVAVGTNQNHPDTDQDGMPDGYEVDYGLNPLVVDADGDLDLDGLTNITEYFFGSDASTPHTDDDGISDYVEYTWRGWGVNHDPARSDSDYDGTKDPIDNCSRENLDQADDDFDGIGNICEKDGYYLKIPGEEVGDGFGAYVSGKGDVNNDGTLDLAVYKLNTVILYSGKDATEVLRKSGHASGQEDGFVIVEDLNGDGFDDLVVGQNSWDMYNGRAYVFPAWTEQPSAGH
jgi:hypothetical protein